MTNDPNSADQFSGKIGGQSFQVITKDLVTVLLLVAGMVGGYLIWLAIDRRLEQIDRHLEQIQAQHIRLMDRLIEHKRDMEKEADGIQKLLRGLDYNIKHPESPYPLEFPPLERKSPPPQP